MANEETIIQFRDATKVYKMRKKEVLAVDKLTLDVQKGEVFGIIGYSGAGKSTAIRMINQLEALTSGKLTVLGQDVGRLSETQLKALRAEIGMVFQLFNLFNAKTIAKNIEFPLKLAKWTPEKRKARVAELLDFVGMSDKANVYPPELSGGQKQRVGIARALATNPKILLADEVTSALDPETTIDVLNLLKQVNKEFGVTIVLITHAMNVASYICDKIAVMDDAKLVELGTAAEIFTAPKHPTTVRFVKTATENDVSDKILSELVIRHPNLAPEIDDLFKEVHNV